MKKNILLASLAAAIIFSACKKTEEFKTDSISDYAPLEIGKYITYQLDSLILADNITPNDTVMSYQVKHLVQDTITDNLGRKGFTIRRFIRKKSTDEWVADNTFFAINTGDSYEFVENNFRFIKLKMPIQNGFTWRGNSYIDANSSYSDYNYYDGWDYAYDSLGAPLQLGSMTVDSTLKVFETDQVIGNPNDPNVLTETDFSVSNYGKGVGLIYHRFLHQEYQPARPGVAAYKLGYGITLTMIDHN
ncbi:MAG: hypothetical protein ABIU77_25955 [Ferruginibacter sp.]|jgi:hypothetical protein